MRGRFARLMFCVVAPAMMVLSGTLVAQETPSEEMKQDIRHLMQATGAGDMARQMMSQMISGMRQSMPNVPGEFWDSFMSKVDTDELIELMVPIYAKYFTHAEVKELAAFYETPLGQKMIRTMPAVMQESMAAGQQWGQQIGRLVASELQAQGLQ